MYLRNPFNGRTTEELILYVQNELLKIEGLFQDLSVDTIRINRRTTPPQKSRDGQIYYADGEQWNPGEGEGPYIYFNGDWYPMFDTFSQRRLQSSTFPSNRLRLIGYPPKFNNTTQKVSPVIDYLTLNTYAPLIRL